MKEITDNLTSITGGRKENDCYSYSNSSDYDRLVKSGGYPASTINTGNYIGTNDLKSSIFATAGAVVSVAAAPTSALAYIGASLAIGSTLTVKNSAEERHKELQEAYKGFDNPDNYG